MTLGVDVFTVLKKTTFGRHYTRPDALFIQGVRKAEERFSVGRNIISRS